MSKINISRSQIPKKIVNFKKRPHSIIILKDLIALT